MKKLLILPLLVATLTVAGQEPLSFEKVIKTDSVGAEALFTKVQTWFATNYRSANNVLQMADKEAGIIVGKGSTEYSYGKMMYACFGGHIRHTITVHFKDNRYKVTLSGFEHSVSPGNNSQCALGLLTTDNSVEGPPLASKRQYKKVWDDLKSESEKVSEGIFASLEKETRKMAGVAADDDW